MTLRLTPDMIEGAYTYLKTTPPFDKWRLPDPDDIEFSVLTTPHIHGHFRGGKDGSAHEIGVSASCVGHTYTLLQAVAHECVHLYQALKKTETANTQHNAEFRKLSRRICNIHGFDHKSF